MPKTAWDGYHRFCPLARGLDVLGDRWTLVVVHELMAGPLRYNELRDHLPGIGTNVLSDRLKRLEAAGLVARRAGDVGQGVRYAVTERGEGLGPALRELRRWGVTMQLDDPQRQRHDHDVSWVVPAELGLDESYEWRIGGRVVTLTIDGQALHQRPGPAADPAVVVTAPLSFFTSWAAGDTSWEQGRASGIVVVRGEPDAWERMLLATAYPGRPAGLAERLLARRDGTAPV